MSASIVVPPAPVPASGGLPAARTETYAEYHARVTGTRISVASAGARVTTNSSSARTGSRINRDLSSVTSAIQLSTMVAASYIDDSHDIFVLARRLADRVTAVEKVMGRPIDVPVLSAAASLTSSERNRYSADIMRAAMASLEGCLENLTIVARQQSVALRNLATLTQSASDFMIRVDEDAVVPGEKEVDPEIRSLVADHRDALREIAALTDGSMMSTGSGPS